MLKLHLKTKDITVFRLFLIILFSLILVSCASYAPMQSKPVVMRSWGERQQILNHINQFQLAGKIAFKSEHDAGSATLNWKENRGQYTVAIFGPFGSNSIKIIGQKGNVILETANGEKHRAQSPESLLAKEVGYQLPVSYLKYWIRGLPVPGLANQPHFDSYHRLDQLQQAGWQVKFLSYTNVGIIDLPTRMQFSSSALQAKIIIYNWQLN